MSNPTIKQTHSSTCINPISEYRVYQTLSIYFTILLNRQIQRRWNLEHKCMRDKPVSQRFRPVIFLEPIPTFKKTHHSSPKTLGALRKKVHLLRARVEKGKELALEIERRMLDPGIRFPTHFCHTCVVGAEEETEILLTKCGHRVCRTCLSFGVGGGVYECGICFEQVSFVGRAGLEGRVRAEEKEG